jgi:hypothetical protein
VGQASTAWTEKREGSWAQTNRWGKCIFYLKRHCRLNSGLHWFSSEQRSSRHLWCALQSQDGGVRQVTDKGWQMGHSAQHSSPGAGTKPVQTVRDESIIISAQRSQKWEPAWLLYSCLWEHAELLFLQLEPLELRKPYVITHQQKTQSRHFSSRAPLWASSFGLHSKWDRPVASTETLSCNATLLWRVHLASSLGITTLREGWQHTRVCLKPHTSKHYLQQPRMKG